MGWIGRRCATGFIGSTPTVPEGLKDNWTEGHAAPVSRQLTAFAEIVETGPDRAKDGVVRWRRVDLKRVIDERFGVDYHERYDRQAPEAARLLARQRATAPSRPEGRDHRGVQKNFPATLKAHLADMPRRTPVEIWFQDEARIGQKNGLVRQWARRGTRPRQPADQRYDSAYLFGAICPARGVGAAPRHALSDTADAAPSRRDLAQRRPRRACRPAARPRRLAHHRQARRARRT